MFAIQKVVRRAPGLLKLSEGQCRTLLGTPPRVRVPFAEKVALGAFIYVGIMAYPIYIMCNVRKYNAAKGE